ncbi:cytochrome b561 and DOMON domain-containing protein At3g61750 isoform X2 [Andrographis paniculata]|uniref:cytochrome b561 and DOMON domain-containing protein At3g61750 isoform X2 n=1 Tax=Andrographis paniculata TaxID=175694 RepID=UPI0021E8830E|nr:cytochrome b561 and DOMON domain-containing protein At3g61750 isoform X2 [Andrographis paniculata]XP_051132889.1 cytochrome b561 and DOMON domain-containing protein At3g61750 isoform X2 [Andrographis paniculata]
MAKHSCFELLKLSFLFLLSIGFFLLSLAVEGADQESDDNTAALCNTDLSSFLPFPYGNLPRMVCRPLWNSYLLRYSESKDNEITVVLSTIYISGWVGIGFSEDGKMLNSSCMVGWMNAEGRGKIKQYHIKGYSPSEIKPDEGKLPLTNVVPYVSLQGATIYLAFQLKFDKPLKTQPILLAFSTKTPHHHHLTHHDDKISINFDFSSGNTGSSSSSVDQISPSLFKDRRTHGTLAILAWGLFLPLGAILARYLRHKESLWYYLHVGFQFIGFLLGVAAVIVGLSLNHKMHAYIPAHKGMGIFVLVLTILQVCAFFTRPSKNSKYRKYWNWYHNWMGRLCLFFAAVNIVLGIHIAGGDDAHGQGQAWKIGYGFLVGCTLAVVLFMEAVLLLRHRRRLSSLSEVDNHPGGFSLNSMEKEISL